MKIIILCFSFLSFSSFAKLKGLVLVFEAPLFQKPDWKSPVVQYKKKGDMVSLHPFYARTEYRRQQNKQTQENRDLEELLNTPDIPDPEIETLLEDQLKLESSSYEKTGKETIKNHPDFLLTIDQSGQKVFIPKTYVKIIYKDQRELFSNVNRFAHDPTDYRRPEPLPKNYPFSSETSYRATLAVGLGFAPSSSYEYQNSIKSYSKGPQWMTDFSYYRKVKEDSDERLYFGGTFHYSRLSSEVDFGSSQARAIETKLRAALGPSFLYDVLRSPYINVSLASYLFIHLLNQRSVEQNSLAGREERVYEGLAFSNKWTALARFPKVSDDFEVFMGSSLHFVFPHNLSNPNPAQNSLVWRENDTDPIKVKLEAEWAFQLGILKNF